ncbi:MAG: AAA family ATPase [Methylocystis silviterrae]|uniref:AAA family ATPase n=1 Tax=Methylocystis silviterrae TaxID=2743612 RepID=UPI003C70A178
MTAHTPPLKIDRAYALARLNIMCETLAVAKGDDRAALLRDYSREMGGYIRDSLLGIREFGSRLWDVAEKCGLVRDMGAQEAQKLFEKSIDEGVKGVIPSSPPSSPVQAPVTVVAPPVATVPAPDAVDPSTGPPVVEKAKGATPVRTAPQQCTPVPTPIGTPVPVAATGADCEAVGALRHALFERGFIPIAVKTGGKAPVNEGWNSREDGDASQPIALEARNTGVRCGGLRAVDIDVDDLARAGRLRELALAKLGCAPIRWRENSSRVTLLYRAAEGEPKKLAITSKTFKSADGKFEKVEVLGAGQQFVAYGTHPTGAELSWTPKGPLEVTRDALIPVTEEQIDAFLAEAAKIIDGPPPTAIKHKSSTPRGNGASGMRARPDELPISSAPPVSPEQIERMKNIARCSLENIANAPPGTSNDTINREAHTLAGLVAAGFPAEGLYERARAVAMERAASDNDPHETRKTFDSGWASGRASPWVPDQGMPAEAVEAARASVAPHLARLAVHRAANDFIKTGGGENACAESSREPAIDAWPTRRNRFVLEPWESITHDNDEEWLVKRILPRRGVAALYGKPGSFKSFVAFHIAVSVASGRQWAGRRVTQAPVVYIAAEGAAGLRKRKAGFTKAHRDLPGGVPFSLISSAPNLGTDRGDLAALVSAIEGAGVAPGLIVIDTLAQTLGAADENGSGMTAFVANAGEIASRFKCLVLIVHHVGLSDDKRLRGHSSLAGALDATMLCERLANELATTLTLQKLKDEASDFRLLARLSRVVMGQDEDGDEISTLVVVSVEDEGPATPAPRPQRIPPAQRLLMSVVATAIDEGGEMICPLAGGPAVRAIADNIVRNSYYASIAEQAEPHEDKDKIAERQRRTFNRAIADAIKAQRVFAAVHDGERYLWLP